MTRSHPLSIPARPTSATPTATWLVDDGVPPNMVQRVMGHERSSTTLDLYTPAHRQQRPHPRALTDPDPENNDPDDGPAHVPAPA